jgi:hypothetical protein
VQGSEEALGDLSGYSPVNISNFSVKCGSCDEYQTLSGFARRDEWNVYSFECESECCDPNVTRTLIEIPAELDEFARRDPGWRGGERHAGAQDKSGA